MGGDFNIGMSPEYDFFDIGGRCETESNALNRSLSRNPADEFGLQVYCADLIEGTPPYECDLPGSINLIPYARYPSGELARYHVPSLLDYFSVSE